MTNVNHALEQLTAKYFAKREEKARISKEKDDEIAKVEADLDALRGGIMQFMQKHNLPGIKTQNATVTITKPVKVDVMDRAAFLDHIKDTGDLSLLQFRPSSTRVKELIGDDGSLGEIPGVALRVEPTLQVRKIQEKK